MYRFRSGSLPIPTGSLRLYRSSAYHHSQVRSMLVVLGTGVSVPPDDLYDHGQRPMDTEMVHRSAYA